MALSPKLKPKILQPGIDENKTITYYGRDRIRMQSLYKQELYGKDREHLFTAENVRIYTAGSRKYKGFSKEGTSVKWMVFSDYPTNAKHLGEKTEQKGFVIEKRGEKMEIVREGDFRQALWALDRTNNLTPGRGDSLVALWDSIQDCDVKAEIASELAWGVDGKDWETIFKEIYPGRDSTIKSKISYDDYASEQYWVSAEYVMREAIARKQERMAKARRFRKQ